VRSRRKAGGNALAAATIPAANAAFDGNGRMELR
jgi:hypothetical protein